MRATIVLSEKDLKDVIAAYMQGQYNKLPDHYDIDINLGRNECTGHLYVRDVVVELKEKE